MGQNIHFLHNSVFSMIKGIPVDILGRSRLTHSVQSFLALSQRNAPLKHHIAPN